MTDIWFLHNRVRIPISGAADRRRLRPPRGLPARPATSRRCTSTTTTTRASTSSRASSPCGSGDAVHVLRPGDAILAPRGVPHTVRAGDRGGRWLVTSTPAGFEAFVRAVGCPTRTAALPGPTS